jgi:hypothetical protein
MHVGSADMIGGIATVRISFLESKLRDQDLEAL